MLLLSPCKKRNPRPLSTSDIPRFKKAIAHVANLCNNAPHPIFVTGGIAIALGVGGAYRPHHDMDIAVFSDDLPAFLEYIDERGYQIYRSIFSGHISASHDLSVLKKTTFDDLMTSGTRHIRLIPKGSLFRWADPFTDCFDLFIYQREGDRIHLLQEGWSVPVHEFFPITRYIVGDGQALYVVNNRYMRRIKSKKETPINILDLHMMENPCAKSAHLPFTEILAIHDLNPILLSF